MLFERDRVMPGDEAWKGKRGEKAEVAGVEGVLTEEGDPPNAESFSRLLCRDARLEPSLEWDCEVKAERPSEGEEVPEPEAGEGARVAVGVFGSLRSTGEPA